METLIDHTSSIIAVHRTKGHKSSTVAKKALRNPSISNSVSVTMLLQVLQLLQLLILDPSLVLLDTQ